jgi:hypothetical protein
MAPRDAGVTRAGLPPGSPGAPRSQVPGEPCDVSEAVRYATAGRVCGDGPSELTRLAVARLRRRASPTLSIVDLECGYGRDSVHLSNTRPAAHRQAVTVPGEGGLSRR